MEKYLPVFRRETPEDGVSLIEVALSIGLIAVVATAVAATVGSGLRMTRSTAERSLAREAARSQLEQVLAWGDFNTLDDQFNGLEFPVSYLAPATGNPSVGRVDVVSLGPVLRDITVTVSWQGAYGTDSIVLQTWKGNPQG